MRALIIVVMLFSILNVSAQQVRNFKLKDIENNTQSFTQLKGSKLTVIDFWATWCKPCVKAIPELNKIYEAYKIKGVEFIGVSCDGPRSVSKVAPLSKTLQIKYPILLDINSEIKSELNLNAFPTLVIVNSNNKIVWVHEGFVSGDQKLVIEEIEKLLK
ncbi:TlpA disulfide reductase family protein [uncultured Lutibacter sp.]|uniref:TlpA family protein disulfide reductase n=1 Tax=uncultured Lutibacter sp. TaxID=437739 RepID=UPI0026060141|nr:TlpA disulfide reductase family protein [uncultured Lutibacter sp.]